VAEQYLGSVSVPAQSEKKRPQRAGDLGLLNLLSIANSPATLAIDTVSIVTWITLSILAREPGQ
jgi:hypothetical protein